jgi:nitroimidazol reductase NimA-like FMN-containing flavoprotein (pyridoxamine 5'-phosphate oxidase superfamily)
MSGSGRRILYRFLHRITISTLIFMKLSNKDSSFINESGVARIATVDSDGIPHVVPVCPVLEKGKIYFATETDAKKTRNVSHNPHVAIVFDEYHDSWKGLRGIMVQGSAKALDRKADFSRVRTALYKKYPKYESQSPIEFGESEIIQITPERKLTWEF